MTQDSSHVDQYIPYHIFSRLASLPSLLRTTSYGSAAVLSSPSVHEANTGRATTTENGRCAYLHSIAALSPITRKMEMAKYASAPPEAMTLGLVQCTCSQAHNNEPWKLQLEAMATKKRM